MKQVRRIINDISLGRFIKEVIHYARKHPNGVFTKPDVGDAEEAENAFMFRIAMEYEVQE